MATRVAIRLRSTANAAQEAWLTLDVERSAHDPRFLFNAEIAQALARDPVSFIAPVSDAQAQVLKGEIVGGLLMTRKKAQGRGCRVDLVSLGGRDGDQRSVITLPSVAFAVAASLALSQALGLEDLRLAPRGGYDWDLVGVEVGSV